MKYLSLLIFLLPFLNIQAKQDSTKIKDEYVGLDLGYNHLSYLDPIESAQVYSGGSVGTKLSLYTFREKNMDALTFFYSRHNLTEEFKNDFDKTNFTSTNFNITYSFYWLLLQSEKKNLYIGPKTNNYIFIKKLNYADDYYEDSYINYLGTLDLSLFSKIDFKKSYFSTYLDLPLINGYSHKYDKTGTTDFKFNFTFLNVLKSFSYNAQYSYEIREKINFNVKYQFDYFQYPRHNYMLTGKYGCHSLLFGFSVNYKSRK